MAPGLSGGVNLVSPHTTCCSLPAVSATQWRAVSTRRGAISEPEHCPPAKFTTATTEVSAGAGLPAKIAAFVLAGGSAPPPPQPVVESASNKPSRQDQALMAR